MKATDALGNDAINACVLSLRAATTEVEHLTPAVLAALARSAARFVQAAKRLRRKRVHARREAGQQAAPHAPKPAPAPPPEAAPRSRPARSRCCYACGAAFTGRHFFYDSLCPPCAALHYDKRGQSADLSGKVALVTGARVSSGKATALKLLRAGATVIGTTRFPRSAALAFGAEPDFEAWSDRLHLHGLDFRAPGWVEDFANQLTSTFHRLDILINNAAQTVRRPAPFYSHLVPAECAPERDLPRRLRPVLALEQRLAGAHRPGRAAMLSQAQVLPEDALALVGKVSAAVDLRERNSWLLNLGEVSSAECLETLLVNAAAPFILTGRLRELMSRDALADKWVVHVTAVEGQFSRKNKDGRHPHLDMAKAALNMLTRTSADDYARDRIYMNSVDVGWFSNGEPAHVTEAMLDRGFTLPLDEVDAAARVCDPIFTGVRTGVNVHGRLLKNFRPAAW